MNLCELLAALDASDWERLKWRVCRRLGVMPDVGGDGQRDAQVLLCAAHMILDARHGRGKSDPVNPGFDMQRFTTLKGG